MTNLVEIKIDEVKITAHEGDTILEAALENDIYIPHLCHHPDLKPVGACRLCGVEVEGRGLVMSCNTPVQEDMQVLTNTADVQSTRQITLELLLADHPEECITCTANNDCELLRVSNFVGVDRERLARMRKQEVTLPIDSSNPFFSFDPNKCILCGICVRTCDEIQGRRAIDFVNRGYHTIISPFAGLNFKESVCESCGECVVRCPVGALSIKNYRTPSFEVESVCSYCGVGCQIAIGVQGEKIVNIRGVYGNSPNNGQLCVKGRFGSNFVNHPDRVKKPLVRQYLLDGAEKPKDLGEWIEIEWDQAINIAAEKLSGYKNEFGSDSVGILASAKCTNEENYLFQKFARQIIGTHNIDHCARL
jgi:predicted molibdopterin-dependent oxidoreductase YjgC